MPITYIARVQSIDRKRKQMAVLACDNSVHTLKFDGTESLPCESDFGPGYVVRASVDSEGLGKINRLDHASPSDAALLWWDLQLKVKGDLQDVSNARQLKDLAEKNKMKFARI